MPSVKKNRTLTSQKTKSKSKAPVALKNKRVLLSKKNKVLKIEDDYAIGKIVPRPFTKSRPSSIKKKSPKAVARSTTKPPTKLAAKNTSKIANVLAKRLFSKPLSTVAAKPKVGLGSFFSKSVKNVEPAEEELEVIKPRKIAQAIEIEVAEDNFSSGSFDDMVSNEDIKNIKPEPVEAEENYESDNDDEINVVSLKSDNTNHKFNLRPASSEIDKKGKFFTQLAREIKMKKEAELNDDNRKSILEASAMAGAGNNSENKVAKAVGMMAARQNNQAEPEFKNFKKSAGLYRRLVIKFILAVSVLALVVAYFSFSKLTLLLTPKTENVDASLEFNVYGPEINVAKLYASSTNQLLAGTVKEVPISAEKIYHSSGEDVLGEELTGRVKLINNYNKDQALVAKTRILSPDNKLFRLKASVNIPAGGTVEADIYTDEPSQDMAISPTRFTIPGLWAGLQTKIYAESSEKFVFQNQIRKYIKPSDLDLAAKDMNNHLLALAQTQVATDFSSDEIVVYKADDSKATSSVDAKAGEAKAEFTIKAAGSVVLVAFPKKQAEDMLKAKLGLSVPDDKELISYDNENIVYVLENYDPLTKIATVKAEGRGLMSLKKDSELVDRTKLINLNREQIKQYLDNFPEIASYDLKFSPSFIDKAPGLVDRIKIQITAPKVN